MNHEDREIVVLALAQNADPADADSVLGQALDGLQAEASLLQQAFEEAMGPGNNECLTLAYSHANRLKALDLLFLKHMRATWRQPAAVERGMPGVNVSGTAPGKFERKLHVVSEESEPVR
jgi:hypothetical protein